MKIVCSLLFTLALSKNSLKCEEIKFTVSLVKNTSLD